MVSQPLNILFYLQPIMNKNIQLLIEKARKDKKVIALAYFGSYARGEKYRDIDICIFLKPKEYAALKLSELKFKYTLENEKYDVQVFQQLPLYVQKEIMKDAKFIYIKNEAEMYDLYFRAFRDLTHYEPIYKEYIEAIANG